MTRETASLSENICSSVFGLNQTQCLCWVSYSCRILVVFGAHVFIRHVSFLCLIWRIHVSFCVSFWTQNETRVFQMRHKMSHSCLDLICRSCLISRWSPCLFTEPTSSHQLLFHCQDFGWWKYQSSAARNYSDLRNRPILFPYRKRSDFYGSWITAVSLDQHNTRVTREKRISLKPRFPGFFGE